MDLLNFFHFSHSRRSTATPPLASEKKRMLDEKFQRRPWTDARLKRSDDESLLRKTGVSGCSGGRCMAVRIMPRTLFTRYVSARHRVTHATRVTRRIHTLVPLFSFHSTYQWSVLNYTQQQSVVVAHNAGNRFRVDRDLFCGRHGTVSFQHFELFHQFQ